MSIDASTPPSHSSSSLSLPILPPPPLIPDEPPSSSEETNTLALLLPHTSLFAPPILDLLRSYYETNFGRIAHWAPVKGFGRVIVVFESTESGERAKREGDRVWLDVRVDERDGAGARPGAGTGVGERDGSEGEGGRDGVDRRDDGQVGAQSLQSSGTMTTISGAGANAGTPKRGHKRRASQPHPRGGLTLRLHRLPPTSLSSTPSHLAPPEHGRNFLISPPGSPPEGWEPIIEDGPNTSTLADDLQRALEHLQLNGRGLGHVRRGSLGKEVILEEGGVRVEVEDTEVSEALKGGEGEGAGGGEEEVGADWAYGRGRGGTGMEVDGEVEEHIQGGGGELWRTPGISTPRRSAGAGAGAGTGIGAGTGTGMPQGLQSGVGTIGETKTRIIPTARPPI